ncbi:MAG: rRNA pseudouridine synthase [Chloroflexi bacterium]|nr:MAG: rRNA pseudouridine synthase [Chloroflexota bacterium]
MEERLQKLLARAGWGSRRQCEEIIEMGRVKVNGRIAKLGDKADPATDQIEVDGQRVRIKQPDYVYIALNKPKGVISSLEDELKEGRRTVRDLIPLPGHLYPVGRLDKQSEGLMLMTNDGDLAHKLTHPRYGHEKTYNVLVEGEITEETIQKWQKGLWLEGKRTRPAKVYVIDRQRGATRLRVVMREGRKRQIRKVAAMLGHPVRQLVREKIGPIELGKLKPGEWRYLSEREIAALRQEVAKSVKQAAKRRPPTRKATLKTRKKR